MKESEINGLWSEAVYVYLSIYLHSGNYCVAKICDLAKFKVFELKCY